MTQTAAQTAAVHEQWTRLVNSVLAQVKSGKTPSEQELVQFEKLVRWGLHIPYPGAATQEAAAQAAAPGQSLGARLMNAGQSLMDKLQQPAAAEPAPAAAVAPAAAPAAAAPAAGPSPEQLRMARERQARDPETAPEVLAELANDPDNDLRLALTRNPRVAPATLALLAQDKDRMVRAAVAAHPSTSADVLTDLAASPDKLVLLRLAQNGRTPPEILSFLADSLETKIQMALVDNPHTPPHILEKLSTFSQDQDVQYKARQALHQLSGDKVMRLDTGR